MTCFAPTLMQFKDLPLYLEWAPTGIFSSNTVRAPEKGPAESSSDDEDASQPSIPGATLFVKNLSLSTTENALAEVRRKMPSSLWRGV